VRTHQIKVDYYEDTTTPLGTQWFTVTASVDGHRMVNGGHTYIRFSTKCWLARHAVVEAAVYRRRWS
jgi:hypothetical protein